MLNLGFAFTGRPVTHLDLDDLHHIGGFGITAYQQQVTAGTTTADPATAAEILDFANPHHHLARKIAVCERVTRSFAAIDATGRPCRDRILPDAVEHRVRLIETLYAAQAHHIPRTPTLEGQPA